MLVDVCGPCYLKLKRREMVLYANFIGKHKKCAFIDHPTN